MNFFAYQIKNSCSVKQFKIKLDDFRNDNKQKNLRGQIWKLSDGELFESISSVYRYCINSVYVLCKKFFF